MLRTEIRRYLHLESAEREKLLPAWYRRAAEIALSIGIDEKCDENTFEHLIIRGYDDEAGFGLIASSIASRITSVYQAILRWVGLAVSLMTISVLLFGWLIDRIPALIPD